MEAIIFISAIISLVISYFIIYYAVKKALSDELQKTNELLERVLMQNNSGNQNEIYSNINNEKDSKIDLNNEIYPKTKKVFKYYTHDAKTLLVFSDLNTSHTYGDSVFIGDKPAKDGKYKIGKSSFLFVENGKVVENNKQTKNTASFLTLNGDRLIIKTNLSTGYEIGDLAFVDDKPAKDGKYKLSLFDSIIIKDGKVVK